MASFWNGMQVVFDVVASPEEFGYVIVREAFEAFGRGFSEKTDVTNNDGLELAVDQQEQLIDELEAQLKELKRHIVDRTGEFNEGSGGCSHPSHEYFDDIIGDGVADVNGCCSAQHSYSVFGKDMDHDEEVQKAAEFDNEDTNEYEESNMYDRMKHQPRLRLKSARIRTLFATYQRRKFRK
ncbi:hypothetical protein DEO72_LG9g1365 [Vigna unguiculata]|uniref:Uncharacterized protein n=1 Tax=Vigna unguiculata TaxID=3917 RepID=A0A4D6MY33_VIGUN|nr:hypothetical protein DEO72_LG9g1365 [Vigna unguiculata]